MTAVLIVDDDADLRDAFRHALEGEGWACTEAADGVHALELLRGGLRPDVILLDLMMPAMNGWEFRREQEADPALRSIPTVVVTASQPVEPMPRIAGFVRKPLTFAQLIEAVEHAASG